MVINGPLLPNKGHSGSLDTVPSSARFILNVLPTRVPQRAYSSTAPAYHLVIPTGQSHLIVLDRLLVVFRYHFARKILLLNAF
jgi:hypothetical protein